MWWTKMYEEEVKIILIRPSFINFAFRMHFCRSLKRKVILEITFGSYGMHRNIDGLHNNIFGLTRYFCFYLHWWQAIRRIIVSNLWSWPEHRLSKILSEVNSDSQNKLFPTGQRLLRVRRCISSYWDLQFCRMFVSR